ncbi:unnamed protein product [Amoebophrya sp. A120]|nr:unnamed protein product [Amoebophrya sp. A120]|eukprot:GSA120T00003296001.1
MAYALQHQHPSVSRQSSRAAPPPVVRQISLQTPGQLVQPRIGLGFDLNSLRRTGYSQDGATSSAHMGQSPGATGSFNAGTSSTTATALPGGSKQSYSSATAMSVPVQASVPRSAISPGWVRGTTPFEQTHNTIESTGKSSMPEHPFVQRMQSAHQMSQLAYPQVTLSLDRSVRPQAGINPATPASQQVQVQTTTSASSSSRGGSFVDQAAFHLQQQSRFHSTGTTSTQNRPATVLTTAAGAGGPMKAYTPTAAMEQAYFDNRTISDVERIDVRLLQKDRTKEAGTPNSVFRRISASSGIGSAAGVGAGVNVSQSGAPSSLLKPVLIHQQQENLSQSASKKTSAQETLLRQHAASQPSQLGRGGTSSTSSSAGPATRSQNIPVAAVVSATEPLNTSDVVVLEAQQSSIAADQSSTVNLLDQFGVSQSASNLHADLRDTSGLLLHDAPPPPTLQVNLTTAPAASRGSLPPHRAAAEPRMSMESSPEPMDMSSIRAKLNRIYELVGKQENRMSCLSDNVGSPQDSIFGLGTAPGGAIVPSSVKKGAKQTSGPNSLAEEGVVQPDRRSPLGQSASSVQLSAQRSPMPARSAQQQQQQVAQRAAAHTTPGAGSSGGQHDSHFQQNNKSQRADRRPHQTISDDLQSRPHESPLPVATPQTHNSQAANRRGGSTVTSQATELGTVVRAAPGSSRSRIIEAAEEYSPSRKQLEFNANDISPIPNEYSKLAESSRKDFAEVFADHVGEDVAEGPTPSHEQSTLRSFPIVGGMKLAKMGGASSSASPKGPPERTQQRSPHGSAHSPGSSVDEEFLLKKIAFLQKHASMSDSALVLECRKLGVLKTLNSRSEMMEILEEKLLRGGEQRPAPDGGNRINKTASVIPGKNSSGAVVSATALGGAKTTFGASKDAATTAGPLNINSDAAAGAPAAPTTPVDLLQRSYEVPSTAPPKKRPGETPTALQGSLGGGGTGDNLSFHPGIMLQHSTSSSSSSGAARNKGGVRGVGATPDPESSKHQPSGVKEKLYRKDVENKHKEAASAGVAERTGEDSTTNRKVDPGNKDYEVLHPGTAGTSTSSRGDQQIRPTAPQINETKKITTGTTPAAASSVVPPRFDASTAAVLEEVFQEFTGVPGNAGLLRREHAAECCLQVYNTVAEYSARPDFVADSVEQRFPRFDYDGDDKLTFEEFQEMCAWLVVEAEPEAELEKHFDPWDDHAAGATEEDDAHINSEEIKSRGASQLYETLPPPDPNREVLYPVSFRRWRCRGRGSSSAGSSQQSTVYSATKICKTQMCLPQDLVRKELRRADHAARRNKSLLPFSHRYESTYSYFLLRKHAGVELPVFWTRVEHTNGVEFEKWLSEIVRQLLKAVAFLHQERLVHGNICPSTVIVDDHQGRAVPAVALAETGLTALFRHQETWALSSGLDAVCEAGEVVPRGDHAPSGDLHGGTPSRFDASAKGDIWSLGVVFYQFLTGKTPPFSPSSPSAEHGKSADLIADLSQWSSLKHISPLASSLCSFMLSKDSKTRPSARLCLQHDWFRYAERLTTNGPPTGSPTADQAFSLMKPNYVRIGDLEIRLRGAIRAIAWEFPFPIPIGAVDACTRFEELVDFGLSPDTTDAVAQMIPGTLLEDPIFVRHLIGAALTIKLNELDEVLSTIFGAVPPYEEIAVGELLQELEAVEVEDLDAARANLMQLLQQQESLEVRTTYQWLRSHMCSEPTGDSEEFHLGTSTEL